MTQNGNRSASHSTFAFIFLTIFLVLNSSILFLGIQAIQVSCFLVPFFDPWPLTSLTSCPHVDLAELWMRSSRAVDEMSRVERLAVNANVATVLGSIPASSDTVESEGRQMNQCWITYIKRKKEKKIPFHASCPLVLISHSKAAHSCPLVP